MRLNRCFPSELYRPGTKPSQTQNWLPQVKSWPLPTVAMIALAVVGLMPPRRMSCLDRSFSLAIWTKCLSYWAIRSSRRLSSLDRRYQSRAGGTQCSRHCQRKGKTEASAFAWKCLCPNPSAMSRKRLLGDKQTKAQTAAFVCVTKAVKRRKEACVLLLGKSRSVVLH